MVSLDERAEILSEALPYILKYKDKIIVIKYGGNAMIDEHLKSLVMEDVVMLTSLGMKVVLVHGGGPEISSMRFAWTYLPSSGIGEQPFGSASATWHIFSISLLYIVTPFNLIRLLYNNKKRM